jgi:hypothetical protein
MEKKVIDEDGTIKYYLNDKLHREDGPAISNPLLHLYEWYLNGQLHRTDGPAATCYYEIVDENWTYEGPPPIRGYKEKRWYQHGLLHRIDGPAVETSDGYKEWYLNGELHRTDGPAIEWNGSKEWYQNGKRHRENGPAVELSDENWYIYPIKFWGLSGLKEWWIDGVRIPNPTL